MIRREWWVLVAVTTIFFFASATTFQSMGIVLYAMLGEFRWSEAAAGGAFLMLALACAATSLLPVGLIPRIGGRGTVVAGTLILALGFFFASATRGLPVMYVAAALFGLAFSLVANTSGIYLIASWFGARAPRMIGLYLMSGTLGGVIGPLVADALISSAGGWRLHWLVMGVAALAIAILCAVLIKEPPSATHLASPADAENSGNGWGLGRTLKSPQFIVVAIAMVATQTCLITVSAIVPSHFARLGWSGAFAAQILSLQALAGTAATGVSGWLTEHFDPKQMLAVGLLAESVGMILLAFAGGAWTVYAFVLVYGIGWSVASLAITVLLIRYFGNKSGSAALSMIWMLCGVAAVGPSAAGMVADSTGSFAPALSALGLLILPIAGAVVVMASPRPAFADQLAPD